MFYQNIQLSQDNEGQLLKARSKPFSILPPIIAAEGNKKACIPD